MPSVNGQDYQHALLKISLLAGAPIRCKTFRKMMFAATSEKKPVNDSTGVPILWTQGELKYEGSITMLRSEWLPIKTAILAQNQQPVPLGILQCKLDWDLTYGNAFVTYQTVKLSGVMFNKDGFESEDNQDPLLVELPLFILGHTDENGLAPVIYQ